MRKIVFILVLAFALQYSFGQIDTTKVTQVEVAKSIQNPVVLVYHTMGDVSVRGHNSDKLFVYAQEFLPSLTDLIQRNKQEVFTYLDKYSNAPIKVKRNANFSIQQKDSIFRIETNVFSYNSNVFVLTPGRSSVGVNIKNMGNVNIENLQGNVEANTNTGDVLVRNVDGAVSASSVHGNIIGDFSAKKRTKPIFISTLIGNIELIIPESSQSDVAVSSEMGTFFSNFQEGNRLAMAKQGNPIKNRKIKLKINGGGTDFVISNFKGDIYLRHSGR